MLAEADLIMAVLPEAGPPRALLDGKGTPEGESMPDLVRYVEVKGLVEGGAGGAGGAERP